jgi:hypothetical protein
MKKYQTILTCFAVMLTTASVVGCSGSNNSQGASVQGTVTVNGSPAPAGLEITLQPVGDGPTSFGMTNSEGQYKVKVNPRVEGATPGENFVAVNFPFIEEGEEEAPATDPPSFKILKKFIAGTYKVTVKKGQNTIDLEIAAE